MQQHASSTGPLSEETGSCASDRYCMMNDKAAAAAMKFRDVSTWPKRGALYAEQ